MFIPLRRTSVVLLAFLVATLLLIGVDPRWAEPAQAVTRASADHPYSDPVWLPLRSPERIGCAMSNCGTSSDHGYWAIDFLGDQGDPIYAAGAGIAHIGGDSGSCSGDGEVNGGRWVWIDHGGGVVSRYHHLDSISIKNGELVTPATKIGRMGHSGDVPPCTVNYLHFEIRHGGLTGERVELPQLNACVAGHQIQLPRALGFDSWNDKGLQPGKRLWTGQYDSSCVSSDWLTSASRPVPSTHRGDRTVTVSLDAPAGARAWAVNLEIWRPSLDAWKTLDLRTVGAGTTSTTFTQDVENDRRYRVSAAVYQGKGWSEWSTTHEVLAVPAAPDVRYLRWKRTKSMKKSYLHYGWSRPDTFGGAVTGYTVARRCGSTTSSLGSWKTSSYDAKTFYKNLRKLKKAKVCEVKIAAENGVGTGDWAAARRVTR